VVAGAAGNDFQVEIVQSTEVDAALSVSLQPEPWLATITLPTTPAVASELTIASTGANNDLTFTAVVAGVAGDALQVEIVQATDPDVALSVGYAAGLATITLPTDGTSAPVAATATAVKVAWDASDAVEDMTIAYE